VTLTSAVTDDQLVETTDGTTGVGDDQTAAGQTGPVTTGVTGDDQTATGQTGPVTTGVGDDQTAAGQTGPVTTGVGDDQTATGQTGPVDEKVTRNTRRQLRSRVTSEQRDDVSDETVESMDDVTVHSECTPTEAGPPHDTTHQLTSEPLADTVRCSESVSNDGQHATSKTSLKHKPLSRERHRKATSAETSKQLNDASQGRNVGSWVTSKKLILQLAATKPASVANTVNEGNETGSCVSDPATWQSRLTTKKSLSLKCTRKPHVETAELVSEVSEEGAQQLTGMPCIVVSDIKREPSCSGVDVAVKRRRMSSASDDASDGDVVVKETIVIASDDPPADTARRRSSGVSWSLSNLKDYEANARRLLKEYDGTQSVDVEELFDECNVSEVLEKHNVIEVSDDDEWWEMPTQLASVRFAMYTFLDVMLT